MGQLTDWMKESLGSKIEKAVVSNRLLETPAIIVSSQYGWSTNMERIMKAQTMGNNDKANAMVSQKTLEINPAHPIIRVLMRLGLGVSKDAAIEEPEVEIEEEPAKEEQAKEESSEEPKEEAKEEAKEDL